MFLAIDLEKYWSQWYAFRDNWLIAEDTVHR